MKFIILVFVSLSLAWLRPAYSLEWPYQDRYDYSNSNRGTCGDEVTQRAKDWYHQKFDEYDDRPYGYYDQGRFYPQTNLRYWSSNREERNCDWYDRRFYRYDDGAYR